MRISLPDITLVCIGAMKDRSCSALTEQYLKRLSHDVRIETREIRESGPREEEMKLLRSIEKFSGHTVGCTEEGSSFTSRRFAAHLGTLNNGIIFIIGGPHGLSSRVKSACNELLSLSPMTFPHEIARMLLAEQLYRAVSIIRNRNYHKD